MKSDLDTPTSERAAKTLATLKARFALQGLALVKGDPAIEAQAPFYALRLRTNAQALASLEDALALLEAQRDG